MLRDPRPGEPSASCSVNDTDSKTSVSTMFDAEFMGGSRAMSTPLSAR
jgi:hypothetical protein